MKEAYDYRLDVPSVEREDKIAEIKILLASTDLTPAVVLDLFEKNKTDVFKGIFRRPNRKDVVIKKIVKSYEPYLLVGGHYELRYLSKGVYDIDLHNDAVSVFILGEEIIVPDNTEEEPEETEEETSEKEAGLFDGLFSSFKKKKAKSKPEIQLEGIEHVHIEKDFTEVRNYAGKSIDIDNLEMVDFTEKSENFLQNEGLVVPKKYLGIEKLVDNVIDDYANVPESATRVITEKLTITDKKILFYPVFWAKMTYKGSEEKDVRLDALTKNVAVPKGKNYAPPPTTYERNIIYTNSKNTPKDSNKSTNSTQEFCEKCGVPIVKGSKYCRNCGAEIQ
ncbi:MAG: zinc ribbon domain-containing protein [Asgard group archaeon]|nr:zinc ribbon domain-containing protein [Asgard group archaeon]